MLNNQHNFFFGGGGGSSVWSFDEHKNLHFDIE